jgi:hypothetical protein
MSKAAFWRPRSQRVKKIHVWRERRASFGELVMQDSPPFRWLEDRGPACQLIALIGKLLPWKLRITFWKRAFFQNGKSDSRWHRAIHAMPIGGWGENIAWKKS